MTWKSVAIFLLLGMASLGHGSSTMNESPVVNVHDHGAVGNGSNDDSQAFLDAWKKACEMQTRYVTLLIPSGKTFLLKYVIFQGPCKFSKIQIQVSGTITGPRSLQEWGVRKSDSWLTFYNVNGLILDGQGTINGQGSSWWQDGGIEGPDALHIVGCNNIVLNHINIYNGPLRHLVLYNVNGATITNLNIKSPGNTHNTDGVGIAYSSNIDINYLNIQSGDDCVALGPSVTRINISNIVCGPGHGISIGSLGSDGRIDVVEGVYVRDCTLTGTQNGLRIKTYQEGLGYVKQVTFSEIILNAVANPIIIDQYYCPGPFCANISSGESKIKLSDISFIGVRGTTVTKDAIKLSCSRSIGCSNITLDHINIRPVATISNLYSSCINAYGKVSDSYPPINCLK